MSRRVAPPVAEVAFRAHGRALVALVYADPGGDDMLVYTLPDERWVADGYRVAGRWVRDAGDRRAWAEAVRAVGGDP